MKAPNCFISASYINNSYGFMELPLCGRIQSGFWSHSFPSRSCSCPPAVDGGGYSLSYSTRGRNSCLGISCCSYLKNKFLGKKRAKKHWENPAFEVPSCFGHKIHHHDGDPHWATANGVWVWWARVTAAKGAKNAPLSKIMNWPPSKEETEHLQPFLRTSKLPSGCTWLWN